MLKKKTTSIELLFCIPHDQYANLAYKEYIVPILILWITKFCNSCFSKSNRWVNENNCSHPWMRAWFSTLETAADQSGDKVKWELKHANSWCSLWLLINHRTVAIVNVSACYSESRGCYLSIVACSSRNNSWSMRKQSLGFLTYFLQSPSWSPLHPLWYLPLTSGHQILPAWGRHTHSWRTLCQFSFRTLWKQICQGNQILHTKKKWALKKFYDFIRKL